MRVFVVAACGNRGAEADDDEEEEDDEELDEEDDEEDDDDDDDEWTLGGLFFSTLRGRFTPLAVVAAEARAATAMLDAVAVDAEVEVAAATMAAAALKIGDVEGLPSAVFADVDTVEAAAAAGNNSGESWSNNA
jgi:hypothetical protein